MEEKLVVFNRYSVKDSKGYLKYLRDNPNFVLNEKIKPDSVPGELEITKTKDMKNETSFVIDEVYKNEKIGIMITLKDVLNMQALSIIKPKEDAEIINYVK